MDKNVARRKEAAPMIVVGALTVLLMIMFFFSSCSAKSTGNRVYSSGGRGGQEFYSPDLWVPFGPFLKPAMFADGPELPGPVDIVVPGHGVVRLDASELLPDERMVREVYTFTYDEGRPVIAGIVHLRMRDDHDDSMEFATVVIGVDVGARTRLDLDAGSEADQRRTVAEPILMSRTNVFKGAEHTMSVGATSDLGVVAVLLEGELLPEKGSMRRLIGVDVVRQTEVWFKEGGSPVFGRTDALWEVDETESSGAYHCPHRFEGFAVASGKVLWDTSSLGGDKMWLDPSGCLTFHSARRGYTLVEYPSGHVGVIDTEQGTFVVEDYAGSVELDPEAPFALLTPDGSNGGSITVRDLATGMDTHPLSSIGAGALSSTVQKLFAGHLYVTLRDENRVIDVRTGDHVGSWQTFPVARLGDHLWMNDGTIATTAPGTEDAAPSTVVAIPGETSSSS